MNLAKNRIPMQFDNMFYYDNKIWFTEIRTNELFYYDLESCKTEFFCEIKEEDYNKKRLFGAITEFEGYIYLIPAFAKNIYKIRVSDKKIKKIEIKTPKLGQNRIDSNGLKFLSAHVYKERIYLVGGGYPAILELDCKTDKITSYEEWVYPLEDFATEKGLAIFRKTILVDKKIYAPFARGNAVVIFDVEDKTYEIREVGSKECIYSSICYDEKNFWLAPRHNGPIVKWDNKKNEWIEYRYFPKNCKHAFGSFGDITCNKSNVFLLPLSSNMIVKVDEGMMEEFHWISNVCMCGNEGVQYWFSTQTHQIWVMDEEYGLVERLNVFLPEEYVYNRNKQFIHDKTATSILWQESSGKATYDFMEYIKSMDEEELQQKETRAVGERIWNVIIPMNEMHKL